jgi:hypothetical protein
MPAVRLDARVRQGTAAGHPSGHRLRRPVPPADTRQWLVGCRTWRTSRPSGRPDTPGPWDRQADGSGPRPDGGGQRTPPAPSVRPCVRSAGHGQPHGLHVLALTGQDGTADAPFGTPSRSQHRDLSGVTPAPVVNAGTSASLVPVRCPRGRVRRPPWTPRSDRRSDTAPPGRVRPDTVHCTRTPWRTAGDADRERTNGTAGVRTCSIATTPRRPARTCRAPHVGPAFAAGQPRLARRWQDRQRDRNHGSDQAAGWCRSTVQAARRRTAVLRSDGWRVERATKLHPLWRCTARGWCRMVAGGMWPILEGDRGRGCRETVPTIRA